MQNPYVENAQFSQLQQQDGAPPAPQVGLQQQFGQSMQSQGQQQIGNQANMIQVPNQLGNQQPVIITQGGEKKKKKTGQKILNALIIALAVILVIGIIALTVMQCKNAKEQMDAQKAAEEAAKQNDWLTATTDMQLCYDKQSVNNKTVITSLNAVHQSQNQSTSVGS